jgi:putative ubiquitin-RnfH superfamily antitoxin RatB of RatAB toxin-antitoxin module
VKVSVAAALPREQRVVELDVAQGITAWGAVEASGVLELYAGLAPGELALGIWSQPCARDTVLREGDRVEIYRPIRADAKEMRRSRARLKTSRRSRNAP